MSRDPSCDFCTAAVGVCIDCDACFGEHCECDPCQHGKSRQDDCVFCQRFVSLDLDFNMMEDSSAEG